MDPEALAAVHYVLTRKADYDPPPGDRSGEPLQSTPCLSAEQEYGHTEAHMAAAVWAIRAASQARFPARRFLVDQLSHLNVTKNRS